MEKDDRILAALLCDRAAQCDAQSVLTHTQFLDAHEQSVASRVCRTAGVPYVFTGGYDDAERRVVCFVPYYMNKDDVPVSGILSVVRASYAPGGRALTHRDFLGSLLALGIDRSVIGDISVYPGGADVIALSSMTGFIEQNWSSAGRAELKLSVHDISELRLPEYTVKEMRDTVASLRLDNIVSSAFGLSRAKAQEAVRRGLVFVNSEESLKPDAPCCEGDRIVLRGSGKAVLAEAGGTSRKDRIYIVLKKYL